MNEGFTITVEVAGINEPIADEQLDRLADELAPLAGVITGTPEAATDSRYGAMVSIEHAVDAVDASIQGAEKFQKAARSAGLPELPIVRLEVMTWDEQDAELERPAKQLVGVAEIAALLGVNRRRASALQTRAGFPPPRARLAAGPVWELDDLAAFKRTWSRKPGRPRKVEPVDA